MFLIGLKTIAFVFHVINEKKTLTSLLKAIPLFKVTLEEIQND